MDTAITANPSEFWGRVEIGGPGECWNWKGFIAPNGYGNHRLAPSATPEKAHRVSFLLTRGRMPPEGSVVMHSCDNRACVNPGHLSEGTYADNSLDMVLKGRARKPVTERGTIAAVAEALAAGFFPFEVAEELDIGRWVVVQVRRGGHAYMPEHVTVDDIDFGQCLRREIIRSFRRVSDRVRRRDRDIKRTGRRNAEGGGRGPRKPGPKKNPVRERIFNLSRLSVSKLNRMMEFPPPTVPHEVRAGAGRPMPPETERAFRMLYARRSNSEVAAATGLAEKEIKNIRQGRLWSSSPLRKRGGMPRPGKPETSEGDARAIIRKLTDGATLSELSDEYGVSISTVSNIKKGRQFPHLDRPGWFSEDVRGTPLAGKRRRG